eukprot:IDg16340t1
MISCYYNTARNSKRVAGRSFPHMYRRAASIGRRVRFVASRRDGWAVARETVWACTVARSSRDPYTPARRRASVNLPQMICGTDARRRDASGFADAERANPPLGSALRRGWQAHARDWLQW